MTTVDTENTAEVAPKYKHDCEACNYLGTVQMPERVKAGRMQFFDLYHCKQGGFCDTVIGRFSSKGPDYQSGLGVAEYAIGTRMLEGKSKTVKEALNSIIEEEDHLTIHVLSLATLKAVEQGFLTEEKLTPKGIPRLEEF